MIPVNHMYAKIILNFLLIILLSILQLAFINGLPEIFSFNLVLLVLIFILVILDLKTSLIWALGAGLIMDIFTFSSIDINLVGLTLSVFIAYILLNNFFTNKSLYSVLALVLCTSLVHSAIIFINLYIKAGLSNISPGLDFYKRFWLVNGYQLIINIIMAFLIFYLLHILGRRLRPVFLVKSKI